MQGMRLVVNALVGAIPASVNVLLVCLIFWLIFAIMGVQLFNGKFTKCLDPEDGSRPDYRIIRIKVECIANKLHMGEFCHEFRPRGKSVSVLVSSGQFKGWIGIMNDAIDSREIDDQPHREVSFIMYLYFVILSVLEAFSLLIYLLGGSLTTLMSKRNSSGGSMDMFMTDDQKKYYAAYAENGE